LGVLAEFHAPLFALCLAAAGGAAGARGSTGGHRWRCCRRARGRDRPGTAAPHRLGAAVRARLWHRHAAPPELRRRETEDRRGHPRAAGDREDP